MKIVKRNNKSLYRRLIAWAIFVLATALYLIFEPSSFDRVASYKFTSQIFPAHAWGVTFLILGIALVYNMAVGSKYSRIRIVLVAIAAMYVMWTIGFILSTIFTGKPTWFIGITYTLVSYFGIHFITEEPYGTNVANGVDLKESK